MQIEKGRGEEGIKVMIIISMIDAANVC